MPTRSSRSPLRIALVVAVVAALHLSVYVGLRIQQGDRLVQYIVGPSIPEDQHSSQSQKSWTNLLRNYNDVPDADWHIVRRNNDTAHSLALSSVHGNCVVRMRVDDHGQGSVAYSMMRMTGLSTPAPLALRQRLNEYEALHELAHCLYAKMGHPFAAPGLTDADNTRLSSVWARSPKSALVALYKELFADAYAVHKYMEHYTQKHLQQQALHDVELLRVWRAANVQDNLRHRHGLSPTTPVPVQLAHAHHATAPMLEKIGSSPEHFMAMPAAMAATELASRFLVAVVAQSSDGTNILLSTFVGEHAIDARATWDKALRALPKENNSLWPYTNYQTLAKEMAHHGWQ